jgi:hypothetical protein
MKKALLLLLLAAPAHADRFGLELRTGAEIPRDYPTVGMVMTVGVGGPWAVGVDYEGVRTLGATLPKSCETTVTPVIGSALRAGVWRRYRLGSGFDLRAGAMLGLAAPALSPGRFPADSGGAAGEAVVDVEAGWSWKALNVSLYLQPSYAVGSMTTGQMCTGQPTSASVSEVGLQIGLGLAVRL